MNKDNHDKISKCTFAHEAWNILELSYESTNEKCRTLESSLLDDCDERTILGVHEENEVANKCLMSYEEWEKSERKKKLCYGRAVWSKGHNFGYWESYVNLWNGRAVKNEKKMKRKKNWASCAYVFCSCVYFKKQEGSKLRVTQL